MEKTQRSHWYLTASHKALCWDKFCCQCLLTTSLPQSNQRRHTFMQTIPLYTALSNYQVKQSPGRAKGMVQQQPPYSTPWRMQSNADVPRKLIGPVQQLRLGHNNIEWTNSEARLLRVQVDCKLPWTFMSVTRRMHL